MNKKIGAGIIGTLHAHAVGHLKALRVSEVFELIAVAEPNEELLVSCVVSPFHNYGLVSGVFYAVFKHICGSSN